MLAAKEKTAELLPLAACGVSGEIAGLPETRVRGSRLQNPFVIGAANWLSSTTHWGCGYIYDETASGTLDQRFYASTYGRFNTPDPEYGGELANPISMNLYNYTLGDPINANDPTGLATTPTCGSAGFSFNGVYQGTISSIIASGSNQAIIAQTAYTESGHGANVDVTDEEYAIAGVLMNRWEFANKNWYLFAGPVGPGSQPIPVGSYGTGGSNINGIAENPGQFAVYQKNPDGSISLTPTAQKNLNNAINSAAGSSLCNDLAWALTEGYSMWGERNDGDPLYLYNGLILTGFNSFGHASTTYEQTVGSFGDANTFYGVPESYVSDTIPPPIRRPRPIRPPRPSPPRPPR